jgi:hypothetical protein
MAREWFFQDADQVLGPLMPADLRRLTQQGRITTDTPIRKGAEGKWVRAAKVPGLFDAATPAVVPIAAPAAPPQQPLGFFAYWNTYWKAARGPVWLPVLLVVPLLPLLSLLKPLLTRVSNNTQVATLGDAAPRYFATLNEYPSRLVLRRKGDLFTLAVDGSELVIHRIDQSGGFRSLEMTVDQSGIAIYEIGVKQLGKGEAP